MLGGDQGRGARVLAKMRTISEKPPTCASQPLAVGCLVVSLLASVTIVVISCVLLSIYQVDIFSKM